ncbi:MAG TPA: methylenetetrahydrofolate--tRNA-(uracil(54)-C(5))-methyltransferase (FADH(2)-oxidizing) TrmFO [Clostridiaceae bacterium]|nr:methylenetetrahydrofolate--tRNA-(uracil(54)-C(5))-methyltransferase (FADH(2)-oxidizing) TrmFO [Clostridiaceae bacterium]
MKKLRVVGAGLAGAEAAWQLARHGLTVELIDIKPGRMSPAHNSAYPAELVCSNSLKSDNPHTASGLLKREMRRLDSIILAAADVTSVPAGSALAVDRSAFAKEVKKRLDSTGLIIWREEEMTSLPEDFGLSSNPEAAPNLALGSVTASASSLTPALGSDSAKGADPVPVSAPISTSAPISASASSLTPALVSDSASASNLDSAKGADPASVPVPNSDLDSDQDCLTLIATGPLTTDSLMQSMAREWGDMLHFFDAAAPIVSEESLVAEHYYSASRYGKGTADYLNCPLDKETYLTFREALLKAPKAEVKEFDRKVFEHCQPIEELAARGEDTMRFGPLKPVGLEDPRTGELPYAVLQLRREQSTGEMYNLVGCQTRMTFKAQREVFGIIPALREAEFLRYGVMHRNHYIKGPQVMTWGNRVKSRNNLFLAGQLTGVEGYMESAASGLITARLMALVAAGMPLDELQGLVLPKTTMIGALLDYAVCSDSVDFQPMNANYGLLEYAEGYQAKRKRERKEQAVLMSDYFMCEWLEFYEASCHRYGLKS